jgi:hypothetical protein
VEFEIITSVKNEYSVLGFVAVWEGPFVSIFMAEEWGIFGSFYPEDVGRRFLGSFDTLLPNYTISYPIVMSTL